MSIIHAYIYSVEHSEIVNMISMAGALASQWV